MQIILTILPPWELQVHVAKDNGILRDDRLSFVWSVLSKTTICSQMKEFQSGHNLFLGRRNDVAEEWAGIH